MKNNEISAKLSNDDAVSWIEKLLQRYCSYKIRGKELQHNGRLVNANDFNRQRSKKSITTKNQQPIIQQAYEYKKFAKFKNTAVENHG